MCINLKCKFKLKNYNGLANITNNNPYAVPNNHMQNGSLTIGDIALNYGNGTGWNTNTSALLLECSDNTEIAIHDYLNRLASFCNIKVGQLLCLL